MSEIECSKPKRIKLDDSVLSENLVETICNGSQKASDDSNDLNFKSASPVKADAEENVSEDLTEVNFLSFSDDVLLMILKYLKAVDLLSVSRCCKRLRRICKDFTLWEEVDLSSEALSAAELMRYLQYLHPSTKRIRIKGLLDSDTQESSKISNGMEFKPLLRTLMDFESNSTDEGENLEEIYCSLTLIPSLLSFIRQRCPALQEFSAEYCNIDAKKVRFEHFPPSLTSISLRNSCVINLPSNCSYFSKIDECLPNLTVLDLSYCSWFVPHSLLAISKCHSLRELRLQGCKEMRDCVPYASLASSFGFGALEKLDLRHTPMGDSEISCFNKTSSLTHLYLEAPSNNDASTDRFCDISDRTVTAFGSRERVLIDPTQMDVRSAILPIMGIPYGKDLYGTRIQVLVLRNYRFVTDLSLKHAAKCMPSLEYLDITGCGCTPAGIKQFKSERPNVTLIHTADSSPSIPSASSLPLSSSSMPIVNI